MTDLEMFDWQRRNAQRRGIPFHFSLEAWIGWWFVNLGPNWRNLRGVGVGKYCMSRVGDKGPYVADNVKCILFVENVLEAAGNGRSPKGERNGRSRLTPFQVLEIFNSPMMMSSLAQKHGVSVGAVLDIKCRRTWKHLTDSKTRTSLKGRNQWSAKKVCA